MSFAGRKQVKIKGVQYKAKNFQELQMKTKKCECVCVCCVVMLGSVGVFKKVKWIIEML